MIRLNCTRKLSKMFKKFIKEYWLIISVIILVFVFAKILTTV